jgi:hypothetical protein
MEEQIDRTTSNEWYQLYRMTDHVKDNFKPEDFDSLHKLSLYVNQVCYHFSESVQINSLNLSMRNLLVYTYDPIFKLAYHNTFPHKQEQLSNMLIGINSDLMELVNDIMNFLRDGGRLVEGSDIYDNFEKRIRQINTDYEKRIN